MVRRRRLLVVLGLGAALALGGCAEFVAEFEEAAGTPTPENVTVTGVVDGDTIDVRFPDGSEDRVRLVGVDTPEVHVAVDPGQYEGIPNSTAARECLRRVGHDASNFTRERVGGAAVELAYDPLTDRRGGYDRLLAYVHYDDGGLENASLNYDLVATGHASVYDTEFTERDRYETAAADARSDGRGLWACAS